MRTIAFHSYKGGTGKSYLTSNLSAIYSENEKICLLDMDLPAPTLQRLFDMPDRGVWLNDYLDGDCNIWDALHQVRGGNLYLGMANPDPDAIRAALGKSKDREMQTLKRMLRLKKTLAKEGFDKLMLDTTPGYEYTSINSIATADVVGIVTILYRPDIVGVRDMIKGLYDVLEKPIFMTLNRYHNEKKFEKFKLDMEKEGFKGSVFGMNCFCDEAEEIGNKVLTLENPNHPISKSIRRLAEEIEKGV
jgi:septum site-determining protein MinD